ncbi:ribosome maturation factor [Neolewinella lacunae]|uniref:Ribosome maturation factor RimP n=1 Tax=Neolewinella lacunae TaxID=1517758 RepID=A0A923TDF4_9BACT|nr:ribosome maturation factor [Neolewinella lacunae]MBC6994782.1 ribosome maturation factor [Neolewinella lacunae]MDN3634404.1 ribosome maturation factor [Neolewinella lacunae]
MVGKITEMLEGFFATEAEFGDCFVVDVVQTNTRLEVYVDCDSGMTFGKCQRISRFLEAYLDEEQPLGDQYTLNVSSPGVDRPLKFFRQYVKNIGRTLEVTTHEGDQFKGQLKTVEEAFVVLETKVRRQEGKRKVTAVEDVEIAFAAIKKSVVKISF